FSDVLVAYMLMHSDLKKIQGRITWIWSRYLDVSEFATAAVATNTALDLARNLIDDVLPAFKHHSITSLMNEFYLPYCLRQGFTAEQALVSNH
ncbi:hypothetical protein QBC36DRAFT_170554, partial [Triangularia setosa]